MTNKRIIFALLNFEGQYQLSRNFRLQSVGDLEWVRQSYDLTSIGCSIDELIVLNVNRSSAGKRQFLSDLSNLVQRFFMPVTAGGLIESMEDALSFLNAGADKISINTALFKAPDLVRQLVEHFGSQCVVGSIDYRGRGLDAETFMDGGRVRTCLTLKESIELAQSLGVGEILLNSIDKDGTGQGLDLDTAKSCSDLVSCPLLLMGGVGKHEHIGDGLSLSNVDAVVTANLFNFMVDGLKEARMHVDSRNVSIARWDMKDYERLHSGQLAPE